MIIVVDVDLSSFSQDSMSISWFEFKELYYGIGVFTCYIDYAIVFLLL